VGIAVRFFLLYGVAFLTIRLALRGRLRLELTEQDAIAGRLGTNRVPLSSVAGVRAGSWWRGGLVLQTASGEEVWAAAPCSWWGGPAGADQVADVERWVFGHRAASRGPR
jgi:hypothetical protein